MTNRYNQIIAAVNARPEEDMIKIRESVDDIYMSIILGENPDCATIQKELGPRFEEDPSNEKIARLLFALLTRQECTDNPLWLEAGEIVVESDSSYRTYRILAQVAIKNGDLARAERLMKKAVNYTDNTADRSDAFLQLGAIESEKGAYEAARSYYQKALQSDPGNKAAYNAIGFLYYQSFDRCKQEKNKVQDRLVFLAAYDKFIAGGNTEMAGRAKEQFPSKVEIFEQNYEIGQEQNTGCWMNESVILRPRD